MEDKEIDKLYELIDSGEYDKAKSALTEIIKNDEKGEKGNEWTRIKTIR